MNEDISKDLGQYLTIKENVDLLTKRMNEVKGRLREYVDGLESDDRGHRSTTIDGVKLTTQRRVSKALDMDAADKILTAKGIKDQCITMVPVINEDAIMAAFYENYLTEEDIDTMFPAKVSYAFIVDNK